jgi:ribonuclease BN (tRNA processing enzyme)
MMRKKKISLIGIFIFIFLFLCEINNINLNEIYSNLINKNNKDTIVETNKPEEIKPNIVESNLNVYFINVGQADCILIQNNDENMLIDAGNNEDGEKLVKYFKTLGITKFKYIVGTHPHEDHIGGLDDIINEFEIEEVLLPDAYTTTKTFEEVLDAIESKNLEITVPEINSNIDIEMIIYGRLELMITKYCPLRSHVNDKERCSVCSDHNKYYLKDRNDKKFRIMNDSNVHLTHIMDHKPTILINNIDLYKSVGIKNYRLEFLDESGSRVRELIEEVKMKLGE